MKDDSEAYVIPLQHLGMNDIERVGGKNASLGEMISYLTELGIRVPGGFSTTARAQPSPFAQLRPDSRR